MDDKTLKGILEKHEKWLRDEEGGERACLRGLYLHSANLREANLAGADLSGVDLGEADLSRAKLEGVNLRGAYLYRADLRGADLRGAYLRGADVYQANLRGADLKGACLHGIDLTRADLTGAKNIPFIPYACPDTGSFIGYKKAHDDMVVKLEILSDARRLSAAGRKCRCDKARVLSITNKDGSPTDLKEVASNYDSDFIYRIGEIVEEPNFCEDRWNECSPGIHFFINRQEAVDY